MTLLKGEGEHKPLGPGGSSKTQHRVGFADELGQAGLLQVVDLANAGSALILQTSDLARRHSDGFELLGRAELPESRGCSLMNLTHA